MLTGARQEAHTYPRADSQGRWIDIAPKFDDVADTFMPTDESSDTWKSNVTPTMAINKANFGCNIGALRDGAYPKQEQGANRA